MILVLGAMVALGPLTIDMYLPALPRIADELGVSSSVAQLTLTGTLAGLALGQLVVGPLSDSLGRRRPLLAGIVLHMLASLLCLVSPDIGMLAIARGLQASARPRRWWWRWRWSATCSATPRPRR
jgi:DHA1 family bicyclomycin/chloramphenicol resistance-like MFS transporter